MLHAVEPEEAAVAAQKPDGPQIYETVGLDRVAHLRGDRRALAGLLQHPRALLLPLRDLDVPVRTGCPPRLAFTRPGAASVGEPLLFLGLLEERPVFAAPARDDAQLPAGACWCGLRSVGALLPAAEAGIAALARALLHWHAHHLFCGRCGAQTQVFEAGFMRRCPACGLEHHPRVDPAVIVLVHDGDHCLLARASRFPEGMVSVLAGFVEPGESPEAAVVREVREETGIEVDPPRYLAAQPWPFPQALMLGFTARARTRTLCIDRRELVYARWFHREELLRSAPPARLPRPDSIAYWLIRDWLRKGSG